jgi:hypothetical protein
MEYRREYPAPDIWPLFTGGYGYDWYAAPSLVYRRASFCSSPHRYCSSSIHPTGLSQKDARRLRSPYRVRLSARTVRRLMNSCQKFFWYPVGYVLLFLVIGFFAFVFDSLIATMRRPRGASIDDSVLHLGLDVIIAFVFTVLFIISSVLTSRQQKAEEAAKELADRKWREQYDQESKDKKARERAAIEKASRQRAQGIERARERKAREIEELERELARYKNIPSEEDDE